MDAESSRTLQGGDADVGVIAAVIGDPHRARMLMVLADGRAHSATELALAVGVRRSAATSHLRKLVDGGLVRVEQVGRFRLHSLASADVARLVEALATLAPARKITSLATSTKAAALREGRSCYDHLAGRLGVAITDGLRACGAVVFTDPPTGIAAGGSSDKVHLGPAAHEVFAALEVDIDSMSGLPSRRPLVRLCVDWSERRYHLAGGLGAAMLDSWLERDWVKRRSGRAVQLTPTGRRRLETTLGTVRLPL